MSTPELTQPEYEALAHFRYQIRLFLRFSENAAREAGIEPQHHQLMLALKAAQDDKGSRIGDLADWLQIQHHSAVELVNRLEEKDLVHRIRGKEDRREVHVALTAKGERILRELSFYHLEELRTTGPALVSALRRVIGNAPTGRMGRRKLHREVRA